MVFACLLLVSWGLRVVASCGCESDMIRTIRAACHDPAKPKWPINSTARNRQIARTVSPEIQHRGCRDGLRWTWQPGRPTRNGGHGVRPTAQAQSVARATEGHGRKAMSVRGDIVRDRDPKQLVLAEHRCTVLSSPAHPDAPPARSAGRSPWSRLRRAMKTGEVSAQGGCLAARARPEDRHGATHP